MKKRLLSTLLALCMVLTLLPGTAWAAEPDSDTCGDDLTWTLDTNGTLTITGTGAMTDYFPSIYDGVTPWFSQRTAITTVVIGNGVTSIGNYAFYQCSSLTSVTIPNSVTSIGDAAFAYCSSLTSVTIPDSVTSIGYSAFAYCSSLTSVTIPDSVTSIERYAFEYCSSLTSVTIPDSVASIERYAFSNCTDLTSVIIPDGVTIIEIRTFLGCSGLTSVTIPGSVTSIDIEAFYGCSSLIDVYYGGNESQWAHISISNSYQGNGPLLNATIHYNSGTEELTDSDGDGIPDVWEREGVTIDGGFIDLPAMGADPNVPDIFVEVDWMVQPEKWFLFIKTQEEISLAPSEEAMRMVYQSFKEHGINLHIDAGPDSVDFVTGKRWGDLSGGNEVPYEEIFKLGNNYEHWDDYAQKCFTQNRGSIFRYALFVNKFDSGFGTTSTGIADSLPGQYFIVSAGLLSDNGDIGGAGTFMHELGHTLGLSHGGYDHNGNMNHMLYKPNYLSIMNYAFQLSGLTGTGEVNYSDYTLPDLDETLLAEADGFDPKGVTAGTGIGSIFYDEYAKAFVPVIPIAGVGIDYNHDNRISAALEGNNPATVVLDLNHDGEFTVLTGTKDWEHIVYKAGGIGRQNAQGVVIPGNSQSEVPDE